MTSLAGVIMAAAAEGVGALDFAGFGSSPDKRVAGVVNQALSRHSIKAISQSQLPAAPDHHGAAAGHGHHDAPVEEHHAAPRSAPGHEHAQPDHPQPHHDHAQPHHDHGHQHEHDHGHAPPHPAEHGDHAKHAATPRGGHGD